MRLCWTHMVLAVACALALAGCASDAGLAPTAQPTGLPRQHAGEVDSLWWKRFGDAQLDALVDDALQHAPDIALAGARIRLAQRQGELAVAQLNPSYAIDASAQREEFSALGYFPPPIGGSVFNLGTVQADFTWDLDWWGKHRATWRLVAGETNAARAEEREARLALSISIARSYFALQADSARLATVNGMLQDRQQVLAIQQERQRAGLESDRPVRPAQGGIAALERQAQQLRALIQADRIAIAALAGQPPARGDAIRVAPLPAVPELPASLPADRIGLRPDVAMQRAVIEVASAQARLARIQFYPDINLSGFAGLQSIGFENLLKSGSETFAVGPAFHLPIFDQHSLRANLGARYAEVDIAVETYNRTVIEAMRQAATATIRLQSLGREVQSQQRLVDTLDGSRSLAEARYRQGLENDLPVFEANIACQNARNASIELQQQRLEAVLDVVRAMGGWPNQKSGETR
ncbi:MAG: efflux transporter outer membrane subunit [Betaproteobacteria bacterium]|nr:efflux transporter outer membrane subunit [Betaproteobacteria bacterium]